MNKLLKKDLTCSNKKKKVSKLKADKNKSKKCIKMIDYFSF